MNSRNRATSIATLTATSGSLLLFCAAVTATAQTLQDAPPALQDQPPALQDQPPQPTPRRRQVAPPSPAVTAPVPATPSNSVEDIIGRATGQTAPSVSPAPPPPVLVPNVSQPAAPLAPGNSRVARLLSDAGVSPTAGLVSGADPNQTRTAITRLEASYGLPPQILNLQNTLPADPEAVIRQLNLHNTPAAATNFSNRIPTVEEIVQALQLR